MSVNQQLNSLWYQILAFLGVIDSIYLINIHNNPGICTTQETPLGIPLDCGTVARSEYSEIFGIPLAIFGLVYYLTLLVIINFEEDLTMLPKEPITFFAAIVGFGLAFTFWLIYLQLFVIELICIYCMGSALITIILFTMVQKQIYSD